MAPLTAAELTAYEPWLTSYVSGEHMLVGALLLPDGDQQVLGIVFNHGSRGLMAQNLNGAEALCHMGYATFLPVRRGHSGSSGSYWLDRVTASWGSPTMGEQLVAALQDESLDVLAALAFLAAHPRVDAGRLAVVSSLFGWVVSIFAATQAAVRLL